MIGSAAGTTVDVRHDGTDTIRAERPLTPHEVRIVGLLAAGASYQAVADRLGVTVNTVRNYIRSIYVKLHVHTKSEAVSKALRSRIIS